MKNRKHGLRRAGIAAAVVALVLFLAGAYYLNLNRLFPARPRPTPSLKAAQEGPFNHSFHTQFACSRCHPIHTQGAMIIPPSSICAQCHD